MRRGCVWCFFLLTFGLACGADDGADRSDGHVCDNNGQCSSGICYDSYCTSECDLANPECQTGMHCEYTGERNLCMFMGDSGTGSSGGGSGGSSGGSSGGGSGGGSGGSPAGCSLTCTSDSFSYSCGSGSSSTTYDYCSNGNPSRVVVSYGNGHTVTCTLNCSGMGGTCRDDTGESCSL